MADVVPRALRLLAAFAALAFVAGATGQNPTDGEEWLVYEGPATALLLGTPPASNVVASSGANLHFHNDVYAANGQIEEPDVGCGVRHFHGTIGSLQDPRPSGCGWGRVISASAGSHEAFVLALAFLDDVQAQRTLSRLDPAAASFNRSLGEAYMTVHRALERLEDLGRWTRLGDLGPQLLGMSERERLEVLARLDRYDDTKDRAHLAAAANALAVFRNEKLHLLEHLATFGLHERERSGCTITGTPGGDVLRGTPGRDVICAGDGDDVVFGGNGGDLLLGGEGDDELDGGPGNDDVRGSNGDDTSVGGPGNDTVTTGPGNDDTSGGAGRDVVDDKREQVATSLRAGLDQLRLLNRNLSAFQREWERNPRDPRDSGAGDFYGAFQRALGALPMKVWGRPFASVLFDVIHVDSLLDQARQGGPAGASALDQADRLLRSMGRGASPGGRLFLRRLADDVDTLARNVRGNRISDERLRETISNLHRRKHTIVRTSFPRVLGRRFSEWLAAVEAWQAGMRGLTDSMFFGDGLGVESSLNQMHEAKSRIEQMVQRALGRSLAASAQEQDVRYWLIYDGPGAGTVVATVFDENAVTSDGPRAHPHNAKIRADGHLSAPEPNCDSLHYHDILFGRPDPDQRGCGWGRVMPLAEAKEEAKIVAQAITAEHEAMTILTPAGGRPVGPDEARRARAALERAMAELRALQRLFPSSQVSIVRALEAALDRDGIAYAALGALARGEGNAEEHRQTALEALGVANLHKGRLMTLLAQNGFLREKTNCTTTGGRALAVIGTDGPDVIRGTPRRDVICAGGGNDRINGLGGNDLILGGDGNDVIDAGIGNDVVHGGSGNDRIRGGSGVDTISTGPGSDRVTSGPGRDIVDGKRERRP